MRIEWQELDEGYKYVVWNDYGTQIIGRAILKDEFNYGKCGCERWGLLGKCHIEN